MGQDLQKGNRFNFKVCIMQALTFGKLQLTRRLYIHKDRLQNLFLCANFL